VFIYILKTEFIYIVCMHINHVYIIYFYICIYLIDMCVYIYIYIFMPVTVSKLAGYWS